MKLDQIISKYDITGGYWPFEGCTTPLVDLVTYSYIGLNQTEEIISEEYFMAAYLEEGLRNGNMRSSTK